MNRKQKTNSMKSVIAILLLVMLCISSHLYAQKTVLVDFITSNCHKEESSSYMFIQKRIINKQFNHDTLEITVATWMNCCNGEYAAVDFVDSTLILKTGQKPIPILHEKKDTIGWEVLEACECECCFNFTFKILNIPKNDFKVSLNDEYIDLKTNKYIASDFEIWNGDTIFKHDSEGYTYNSFMFYESGKIKSYRKMKNRHYVLKCYYENGQIKMEHESFGDIDNSITKEYDVNGALIKLEDKRKKQ